MAILNQNTPGTVVGLLAAWRLGAAVMPLSPMLTSRELVHYLKDGEPAAVLVGQVQAPALYSALTDWGGNSMVAVTDARDFLHDAERPALLEGIPSESELPAGWHRLDEMISPAGRRPGRKEFFDADTALVTYTSGTTGQPKGALNSHANVAFSAEVYRRWLALCPDDVLFAAAPFSHVTGLVGHIAAAFMSGAAMVMCYRFEPATVLELLERRGCTTTIAAITAYISLLNHPSFVPSRLAALKKVFSGGAPVAPAVVDRWEAATGVYIHNAYGLTETTSPSHWCRSAVERRLMK
ncbi:hypothetical protein AWV79_11940 [Cupriavidus sp. UYMMa02A]|nr:hypothetical protein AWV79_11940 [Cupriavidus sp. UYMMa02A]